MFEDDNIKKLPGIVDKLSTKLDEEIKDRMALGKLTADGLDQLKKALEKRMSEMDKDFDKLESRIKALEQKVKK